MKDHIEPDPSRIGGVPSPPFAFVPKPANVFETRAHRFAFLAETSNLGPYLKFLGDLASFQALLCETLPPVSPPSLKHIEAARNSAMPPIDRRSLVADPELSATLKAFCETALEIDMPQAARTALERVSLAAEAERHWLLSNVLSDDVPSESPAHHLFVAGAVQVHLSRLAATLDPELLVPISVGICPACGGRPGTSSVMGSQGIENVRYASCACCTTQWNEVRVKCLCCGSTQGITYRSAETHDATVKAETCAQCKSWVKILYHVKNPSLDPVADDVGSLGLDMLMKETGLKRGGFNPFLVGY